MRPLDGCLVLDFSTLLPGPLATLILAEAGAEVVKVERPGGDEMRAWEPRWGSQSVNFALLNRGKKSVVIDLQDAQHREKLKPFMARADVLVAQYDGNPVPKYFQSRPSTRRSTNWWTRGQSAGGGGWTGWCSTWNQALG